MEINTIDLHALHNEEHFGFQKELKELVELNGKKNLNIETDYDAYLPFFENEEAALNIIRKSATTKQIEDADKDRDTTVNGLVENVESQLKHYDAEKRAAAARYVIILDQYGDIARKPYDDETAAIHKLVLESKGTYALDVSILALTDWIAAIDTKNLYFQSLKKDRHSEDAQKPLSRMKEVRADVDAAYKQMIKRVNALIVVNGMEIHEVFVRELNSRIDKTNNTLAQRKGRAKKNADKNKKENTINTEKK